MLKEKLIDSVALFLEVIFKNFQHFCLKIKSVNLYVILKLLRNIFLLTCFKYFLTVMFVQHYKQLSTFLASFQFTVLLLLWTIVEYNLAIFFLTFLKSLTTIDQGYHIFFTMVFCIQKIKCRLTQPEMNRLCIVVTILWIRWSIGKICINFTFTF